MNRRYLLVCARSPCSPLQSPRRCCVSADRAPPDEENNEGQVRASVTPQNLSKTADAWRFEVQFQHPCDADHPGYGGGCLSPATARASVKSHGLARRSARRPSSQGRAGVQADRPDAGNDHAAYPRVGGVADRAFTWNLASP